MNTEAIEEEQYDVNNYLYKEENNSRADSFSKEFDRHAGTDINMMSNYNILLKNEDDEGNQE